MEELKAFLVDKDGNQYYPKKLSRMESIKLTNSLKSLRKKNVEDINLEDFVSFLEDKTRKMLKLAYDLSDENIEEIFDYNYELCENDNEYISLLQDFCMPSAGNTAHPYLEKTKVLKMEQEEE